MDQLLPFLGPIIAAAALLYTIVSARSKAGEARVSTLEKRLMDMEREHTRIIGALQHLPDKETTHRMELAVSELKGSMATLNERIRPIAETTTRLQEFLLEQAKR